MISVAEALERIAALVPPVVSETVRLEEASGRVLAAPVTSRRTQPPFAASAMDGYAITDADWGPGNAVTV
ncbi:MAG: molybdopterin molybdenumtransferase MoeA, partial [Rubricella sp.]